MQKGLGSKEQTRNKNERITRLAKSPEQASYSHQVSDSHTTTGLDTHCIHRRWRMNCMCCTDCSHSAVHTPSIPMGHRLAMIDPWGYRSSGDHTEVGIGHIVVSHMSCCGRIRVYCRSQPQLAAGVRPAGFVAERSL